MKIKILIITLIGFFNLIQAQNFSEKTRKGFKPTLGFNSTDYDLNPNPGFISDSKDSLELNGGINIFLDLEYVFQHGHFGLSSGIGASFEIGSVFPKITLKDAEIGASETTTLNNINTQEWLFHVPINLNFDLPNLFPSDDEFGIRFYLGATNRFRMYQYPIEAFTEPADSQDVMDKISDKYSDFFSPYSLQANGGIGAIISRDKEVVCAGFKATTFIIHPFNNQQTLSENLGWMVFMDVTIF